MPPKGRGLIHNRHPETDYLLERVEQLSNRTPIREPSRSGGIGANVLTSDILAKITAAIGTSAPYLYSAVEVTGGANWDFPTAPGGRSWSGTLRNLAEIGDAGSGSARLPPDTVVSVFTSPDGSWYFDRLNYRGTYG